MAVLRKLISRFSFDVDKKSVKEYDKTIGGMKSSAMKLAGVFGAAFSAKKIFDFGMASRQTTESLKQVAGVKFGAVESAIESVANKLDKVQKGAGDVLRGATGKKVSADFIRQFDPAIEKIGELKKILEFAGVVAVATGQDVQSVFAGVLAGKEGVLDFSLGLPDVDKQKLNEVQDALNAFTPDQFGGKTKRAVSTRVTMDILSKVMPEMQKRLAELDPALAASRTASEFLRKEKENLIEPAVAGAINTFADSMRAVVSTFDIFKKAYDAPSNKNMALPAPVKNNMAATGAINRAVISQSIKIDIHGATDAKAVANEIDKKMKESYQEAGRQLISGEDTGQ